jgi:hypothetical protein
MLLLLRHTGKTSIESVLRGGHGDGSACLLAEGIIRSAAAVSWWLYSLYGAAC